MITFLICLALLVVSYFTYGKYLEKTMEADPKAEVPSKTHYDGVDYLPMPKWKTFLIQLLNIAGLGPIFGALLGAMYGPVAFLWITLGGILVGAMHDYVAGMLSVRMNGWSLPEIIGCYLGLTVTQFMRILTLLLMVMVGAVFMVGPAGILQGMTGLGQNTWLLIILAYYFLATLLPIDAIIGRIYPIFGAALLFMALGILYVLIFGEYTIPELGPEAWHNFKADAAQFPIFPTMFVTIACGAVSGFHATQSPLVARCMNTQMEGRPVFFGAMISESVIALIWAAVGMAFWGGASELNAVLAEHGNSAAWAVNEITHTTLGKVGAMLALLGVVAAPITTGDTAFRGARLIAADFLHLEQRTIRKRLYICMPLFAAGFLLTQIQFDIIWRYFAWMNQALAAITLWALTVYLYIHRKNWLVSWFPALFMTMVVMTYILTAPEGFQLSYVLGLLISAAITVAIAVQLFFYMARRRTLDVPDMEWLKRNQEKGTVWSRFKRK